MIYWIIAILILLLILVAVFFFLKSKVSEQQDSLSTIKDTQEKLESKSIKLDTKFGKRRRPGVIWSADSSFTNIPNTISSGYLLSVKNYSKKNKRKIT